MTDPTVDASAPGDRHFRFKLQTSPQHALSHTDVVLIMSEEIHRLRRRIEELELGIAETLAGDLQPGTATMVEIGGGTSILLTRESTSLETRATRIATPRGAAR